MVHMRAPGVEDFRRYETKRMDCCHRIATSMKTKTLQTGAGDNQVIRLTIPPSLELERRGITMDDYVGEFINQLEFESSELGMEIKKEET